MKYLLGTGFYGGPEEQEFFGIWSKCLIKYCSIIPEEIVVLSVGDSEYGRLFNCQFKDSCSDWPVPQQIVLPGNLGHVGELLSGNKSHWMCGWSAALLWGVITAYANGTDYLWVEQDTLAFGNWFPKMIEDLEDGQWIFGHKHPSEPFMHCSQSIVYIRHSWIPTFIKEYCTLGPESDVDLVPETKFRRIEMLYPKETRRLSFGVDRCRPIPWNDPVWYAQKFTEEEMAEIYRRGLL